MTDEPARASLAGPDRSPQRTEVPPAPLARRRDFLPALYLVGFLVLAGSLLFLWQNPPGSRLAKQDNNAIDQLRQQVTELQGRVAELSKLPPQVGALTARPVVQPDTVQALSGRVGALENRTGVDPASVQSLAGRVSALENRPAIEPGTVRALSDRIAALEGRKPVTPEQLALLSDQVQKVGRDIPDLRPLLDRLGALEARPLADPAAFNGKINDLTAKLQSVQEDGTRLAGRVDADEKTGAAQSEQLKSLTQRAQVIARLQGMSTALAAGQKLGEVPGAPPALARFAYEAPPTEGSLRNAFDGYADAAQKASQPAITDQQGFASRLWTRAQQAVTVRQGDRVLVGDPIAGVLTAARDKLDNGDLPGAIAALKGLAGPAAAAMQPWIDRAQSLVAARAALASLAAN